MRRLRARAGPVNLLLVDFADPPSMRVVIRGAVEPLGRFLGAALTGGAMPGGSTITIDDETAMLEHVLDADPRRSR